MKSILLLLLLLLSCGQSETLQPTAISNSGSTCSAQKLSIYDDVLAARSNLIAAIHSNDQNAIQMAAEAMLIQCDRYFGTNPPCSLIDEVSLANACDQVLDILEQ